MRILIDTNVILDVLLKRTDFYDSAARVLTLSQEDDIRLYVSASAVTDIYYIANQALKNKLLVRDLLSKLVQVVWVAGVSEREIKHALGLPWSDFEDSVQYSVALLQEMDGIVTWNAGDYKASKLQIWSPKELLAEVENRKKPHSRSRAD